MRIHGENNSPFLTVTHLAVEEHIQMKHSGAELNGPFSRYDYQRTQDAGASVKSFKVLVYKNRMSYLTAVIVNILSAYIQG